MAEQFGIFENKENVKKEKKEVNLALQCHHVAGLMQVNEDKHVILMLFFILKSYY